jgi:hypothetical protein
MRLNREGLLDGQYLEQKGQIASKAFGNGGRQQRRRELRL